MNNQGGPPMLDLFSTKKTINLVIDDYAIRMVDYPGGDLTKVKSFEERAIPDGLLEHGRILDDMEFYQFMKDLVQDWGLKRRHVRFYVPDSLMIMKKVEFPAQLKDEDVKGHFYMELGRTFYLPFENPIFDVYPLPVTDPSSSKREGLLFAVPEEELNKYTAVFEDVGLIPVVADVRSIGIYRYYRYLQPEMNPEEAILFFELNLNSIVISIFSEHKPEFLRFLDLDVSLKDWRCDVEEDGSLKWVFQGDEEAFYGLLDDQMIELERIMNFYRYSLHKGEKQVSRVILLGDFPRLDIISKKVSTTIPTPIRILDAYLSPAKTGQVNRVFIPSLGLALKGEVK